MAKIGLAGNNGSENTVISQILSEITNLSRVYVDNIEELYKEIYNIDKDLQNLNSSELLCMGLVSFHSRVKQERQDNFISDGTVLNEFVHSKTRIKILGREKNLKNIVMHKKYMGFLERLERTIVDYAKSSYDVIYYLIVEKKNIISTDPISDFRKNFDKYFLEILTKNKINHKVLEGNIELFVREILSGFQFTVPRQEVLISIISEKEKLRDRFQKEFIPKIV